MQKSRKSREMIKNLDHKDNCGTGSIINLSNQADHNILVRSLQSLINMKHRGAVSHDGLTPDGCGVLIDLDKHFFQKIMLNEQKKILPSHFAVGVFFVNHNYDFEEEMQRICKLHSLEILGMRVLKTNSQILGKEARSSMPKIVHLFVRGINVSVDLEAQLFKSKKFFDVQLDPEKQAYCVSFSSETVVYKGLVQPEIFKEFYTDLADEDHKTASSVFHVRFSTNTSPKWYLAQPYRVLAHNGEINTISGNRSWALARTRAFDSNRLGKMTKYQPLIGQRGSDSSSLDHILDLFRVGGIGVARAARMLIPPSWQNTDLMDSDEKAFHEYNSMHMEAWDGPALICFQSKEYTCCFLDRNGLRPARIEFFSDGSLSIASEVGTNLQQGIRTIKTDRLGPGGLILFDRGEKKILLNDEVDKKLSMAHPYREWLNNNSQHLEANLHEYSGPQIKEVSKAYFEEASKNFQLTREESLNIFQTADEGNEPTGSMGDDTPIAPISNKVRSIYDYCRQKFAQVTNPPIDSLREKSAMSLETCIGPELNIFEETKEHASRIVVNSPILSHKKYNLLLKNKKFKVKKFSLEYSRNSGLEESMKLLLESILLEVRKGTNVIVLDERQVSSKNPVIHALLMTSALHSALIENNLRVKCNIVVNTASARDNHQISCLIAFGATCVHPWLGLQAVLKSASKTRTDYSKTELCVSYRRALNKGLLKIMSKMGISNISSYRGSRLFDVLGFSQKLRKLCFPGMHSTIQGDCFNDIHEKSLRVIDADFDSSPIATGLHKYTYGGENHAFSPDIVMELQSALSTGSFSKFKNFSSLVENRTPLAIRDFFNVKSDNESIPIAEVESIESILKRFDSAGMSLGSLSPKAHETLAAAMNSLGCRSNSGEGGEDPERFGTQFSSKIKQIASGRFGVTPNYLVNAEVLQIKIAQGAKPGEGGQLPGTKVDPYIAKLRFSKPGVTLISPPPHHDIYSIEDLAQLIYDLKQINDKAMVSVKLVSEPGVGIVAAGVVKANADFITISGHDGGTGASPISSIRHAGSPWEVGMHETQNILLESNLRSMVKLQTDGGLKVGLDVVKAAIFGADSFGFGTAPMIAMGCKYLRICHLNNCATGVATQHIKIIEKQFDGEVEKVRNYFLFIAQEVREYLAQLGFRSLDQIVGKTNLLHLKKESQEKAHQLGLEALKERYRPNKKQYCYESNSLNLALNDHSLAQSIHKKTNQNIKKGQGGSFTFKIRNTHRSIGAKLSGEIARKFGVDGFPETLILNFTGTAGQSFGCWNSKGQEMKLKGFANDYVGKGMNGGKITITRPNRMLEDRSIIMGNTCLFGATGGELYGNGIAGERFAVRNSGCRAIIEGAGDHCCEYMTGGEVIVLGPVGQNFGAGMTGGFAYVLDEDRSFVDKCNKDSVTFNRITSQEMEAHKSYLKDKIYSHIKETGSEVAKKILANFDRYQSKFWIVTPNAENLARIIKNTREEAA